MQEIAYQLWKSFDSFEFRSSFSSWLYRVALNTAIQSLKREKSFLTHNLDFDILKLTTEENQYDTRERVGSLMNAIHSLQQIDKGIILLYLEENSHAEIAEIIGISITNVGTRIQRIKKKLKNQLKS